MSESDPSTSNPKDDKYSTFTPREFDVEEEELTPQPEYVSTLPRNIRLEDFSNQEIASSTASAPLPPPPLDEEDPEGEEIDIFEPETPEPETPEGEPEHYSLPPVISPPPTIITDTEPESPPRTPEPILDFAPPDNPALFPTLAPPSIPGNRPRKSIDLSTLPRSPRGLRSISNPPTPETTPLAVPASAVPATLPSFHTGESFGITSSGSGSSGNFSRIGTLVSTDSNVSTVNSAFDSDSMLPPSQLFGTMNLGSSPLLSSRIDSIYPTDIISPTTDSSVSPRPGSQAKLDDDTPLPPPDEHTETQKAPLISLSIDSPDDDEPLPPPPDEPEPEPEPDTPQNPNAVSAVFVSSTAQGSRISIDPNSTELRMVPNTSSADSQTLLAPTSSSLAVPGGPDQQQIQSDPESLTGSKAPSISWKTVSVAQESLTAVDDIQAEEELIRLYGKIPPPTSGGKKAAFQYNMRLKCTRREGDKFVPRRWNLTPDQLLQFGFGVGLYFFLNVFTAKIALLALCLSFPIMIYHFVSGAVAWPASFGSFLTQIMQLSYGNHPDSVTHPDAYNEHFLWQLISDIITSIAVLFMLFKFIRFVERKFESNKVNIPTASDFTVVVTNPPKDATDPAEYAQFFSRWGTVINVTLGFNHGNLAKLARERLKLIEDIKAFPSEKIIDDFSIFLDLNDPHPWGQGFLQPLLRSMGLKRDLQFFKGRLLFLDRKLKRLLQDKYRVCRVYITFSQRSDAFKCLKKLYKPSRLKRFWFWLTKLCRHPPRFYGRKLYVTRAGEPSDILWANIHIKKYELFFRQIITSLATVLIVFGSFLGILYLSSLNQSDVLIRFLIAILIITINKSLIIVMRILGLFEKRPSYSDMMRGIMTKTFLFQFANTAFVPFLVGNIKANNVHIPVDGVFSFSFSDLIFPRPGWFPTMLPQVLSIVALDAFLSPILRLILPVYRFRSVILTKFQNTQADLNSLLRPPPWMISEYYANALKMLFVMLFYSTAHPIVFLIYLFGFALSFQTEKLLLLRLCRKPSSISRDITKTAAYIAAFAVPIKMFSGILFYTYFINTVTNTTPGAAAGVNILMLLIALGFTVISFLFISGDFLSRHLCRSVESMQVVETKNVFYSQVPHIDRYAPPELPPPEAFERAGSQHIETDESDAPIPELKGSEMANPQATKKRKYHASSRLSIANVSRHRNSMAKDSVFSVLSDGRTEQGHFIRTDLESENDNNIFPMFGDLDICVESCSCLPKLNGRSTPTVKFVLRLINSATCLDAKFKCNKAIKSVDPEWEKEDAQHTFENIHIADSTGALKFELFTHGFKQPLGQVGFIPFSMIHENRNSSFTKTFELEKTPGQKYESGGFVRITFFFRSLKEARNAQI